MTDQDDLPGLPWATMDAALGVFREAGLSDGDAADSYFTITNYVTGFCSW